MNDHVTASSSPRAASTRRAVRRRFWIVGQHARRDVMEPRQRIDRHLVDAHHAHHLLDEVGLLRHVGPERRHRDAQRLARAAEHGEAEPREDAR